MVVVMRSFAIVAAFVVAGCAGNAAPAKSAPPSESVPAAAEAHITARVPASRADDDGDTSERRAKTAREAALPPFPRDDVRTALRAAEGGLHSCNQTGTPRTFEAALSFDPSGKVGKVQVIPADRCVEARLREVEVTPFRGQSTTVRVAMKM
jgi:hypothetical protein